VWLLSLACAETPPVVVPPTSPTNGTTTEPPTPPVAPCASDPAMRLLSAETSPGLLANQAALTVRATQEGAVAVRCTSQGDPTDVHLVEGDGSAEHRFLLGGLLTDDRYDCVAAAVCPQSDDPTVTFAVDTGPAPDELVPVDVDVDPALGMTGAWTLFNLEVCGGASDWLHLVDPQGRTRWWQAMPLAGDLGVEARYAGAGRFVYGGGYTRLGRARAVDLFAGEVYDSAATLVDYESTVFHHDAKQLADGRVMTLESQDNVYDGLVFEGFAVRVHDPATQTVSWEYDSQRAVDEGRLTPGDRRGDVWHANWADVLTTAGEDALYVSLCDTSNVVKIDPVAQQVEWIFGKGGDFSLVGADGAPLPNAEFPSCQHGLEVAGDKLLVYDNGWVRNESRVAEYRLDEETRTATLLWTWTDGWYMCCLGDVDYLPRGRVLVNQARFGCGAVPTRIREIVPETGEIASTVTLRATDSSYRAERIDGCTLFASAATCPWRAARVEELAPLFD
jgi:Arylsulfotransferase (ASST)